MHATTPLARSVLALLLAVGVACSGESTKPSPTPTSMTAVAGAEPQSALVGTAVGTAPAVKVVDQNGAGMAGVNVTFSVTAGGGSVEGGSATTDVNGVASVTKWTLGTTAGANSLKAQSGNLSATFTATGLAGAASVLVKSSADSQTAVVGGAVAAPPSVTVKDANGNPVAGIQVTFMANPGNGSVTSGSQVTSATGVATVGSWTLSTTAGTNTLIAAANGVPFVTFTATGTAGPPTVLDVTPVCVVLTPASTQQLKAAGRDQYGNSIDSVAATYSTGNGAIATVSGSGLVTAVAPGTTTISIASGAASATIPAEVGNGGHPGCSRVDVPEAGRPFAVRASVNGVVLVSEQDNSRLGRYNLPSTAIARTIQVGGNPADVNFSADGLNAYVTNLGDATLGVIDVATNTQLSAVPISGSVWRVAPSRDGSRIYVTTGTGTFFIVDATTLVVSGNYLGASLNGLAVHPTQPVIYVTGTNGTLFEVSETTGQPLDSVSTGGRAQDVVLSKDGTQLYIAIEDGALQIRAASDLSLVATVPAVSGAFGLAATPDGAQLYAAGNGKVLVVDLATRTVLRSFDGGAPRRVTFDRTGSTAIIANEAGYVTFIK